MKKNVWESDWVKLEPLGGGGQGHTYKSRRSEASSAEPTHVLKILKRQDDAERRARMHQEVANLQVLDHPAVSKYAGGNDAKFRGEEELFLVTEYVPGPSLSDAITTSRLDIPTAVAFTNSILDALEHCHAKNVVHRDIKPDNIILRDARPESPVLLDFGLSFNEETQSPDFKTPSEQHIGNRFLELPEYRTHGSDKRDPTSDLTQVVGVLFYALTGRQPDTLIDEHGKKPHQRSAGVTYFTHIPDTVRPQLQRIFDVGFSNNRYERWQSISVLRAELHKLLAPPPVKRLEMSHRLLAVKRQMDEIPAVAAAQRFDILSREAARVFGTTLQKCTQTLELTMGGIVSQPPPQAPEKSTMVTGASCATRHFLDRATALYLYVGRHEAEFVLWCAIAHDVKEVIRIGLFDPAAKERVAETLEDLIMEQYIPRLFPPSG